MGFEKLTALKEIRTKKHLSREELSYLSEIPAQTIQALEDGLNNPRNAKLSTLLALARALKCKVRHFYPNEKNI